MKRVLWARIILTLAGVAVWGYGTRFNMQGVQTAGIAILAVALLLRFAPKHWFEEGPDL